MDEKSPSWNDSFWEGANIPQLDGNCDDESIKTYRKRKKRPLKLGLSRPKSKIKPIYDCKEPETVLSQLNNSDEINESRETIDCISNAHLRIKSEIDLSKDVPFDISQKSQSLLKDDNIVNLVEKIDKSSSFSLNYEPKAGPSYISPEFLTFDDEQSFASNEDEKAIESFYDQSNFFDLSMENSLRIETEPAQLVACNNNTNVADESTSSVPNNKVLSHHNKIWTPKYQAPSKDYVISTLDKYNIPKTKNQEPYYSNYKDVGDKIEIGQMILKLNSTLARDQKPYEKVLDTTSIEEWRQLLFLENNGFSQVDTSKPDSLKQILAGNRSCILQPLQKAPTTLDALKWCELNPRNLNIDDENIVDIKEVSAKPEDIENSQAIGLIDSEIDSSMSLDDKSNTEPDKTLQISMHTDGSFLCFGKNQSEKDLSVTPNSLEVDFLTIMVAEVHTSVRSDLNPDPALDVIEAAFVTVANNCLDQNNRPKHLTIIIVVDNLSAPKYLDRCVFNKVVIYVKNENELIENIINLVKEHDPDIMCGYEIEMNSWGYILERAQIIGVEVVKEISRITEKHRQKKWRHDENEMEGRIIGRITFNVWRLFRYELALSSYSFENCMYVVLNERVPKYSYAQLANWWNDESRLFRWITVENYMTRLSGTVRMLEKLDIVNRTSELARLFGLQWWEVLSRGSQFRVESLMLRAARPLNLVALSPTVKQRAAMKAPECLPLIFEPESRFYHDPVIVLDFQSLYPSMMIAYNYCFSTCIGRVQNISCNTPYEFGAWRLRISEAKLKALAKNDLVNWSPVGIGFVKPSVRRGVLPALLRRILAARQAVKKGMKLQTDDAVKKAMHSRQLGLKLIANVTYGYTAANFSGRMPCVEVGDSVVAKGRETLERAIKLVRNGKWNAKVIYGDTDSMFVLVPGGTRAEAFIIGQQIADAVTADNPSPVVLKLEKVYQPCILQTKKRYVGYMYESPEQAKPVYEAKGIETVRRDGCPAGVKLLQRSLCELFDSGDMSRVKRIACGLLTKLSEGSLPPHELFFTREYHGAAGYRPTAAAPPNEIAKRLLSRDRRAAPRTGERVSWLVCAGPPGTPLVRLARSPPELTRDAALGPHVTYYATRALLPPLHRCLSLLGADVFKWWNEVGYTREVHIERSAAAGGGIARYMQRGRCAVCGARGARALCGPCAARGTHSAALLAARAAKQQTHLRYCYQICGSCCNHGDFLKCENTECPILWKQILTSQKLNQLGDVITNLPEHFNVEARPF
ncbi:DNA polymerase zeta catalytic subunit isoform X3 [Leptidea sinapis]|nr:DNA polymerase zeta catalytic subunit isoform X3 [Leptidea sinapis]